MLTHRALFLLSLCGLTLDIHSAPITWGPATDPTDANDISTNGPLVEAFNAGSTTTGTTETVNGVLFTGTANLLSANSSNDSFAGDTGDVAYNALLSSFDFGGGTTEDLTVGGGNLIIGESYQIQVWHAQAGGASTRVMTFGDGESANTVDLIGTGQYAIGSFTASDTTQVLSLATNGFGNCHFSAYQIRQADEPPLTQLFTTGLLDLSGRDSTGLGAGESGGLFTSPKTFGPTTDFSLNDIPWSSGAESGSFDVSFVATSSLTGLRRGGQGAFGTAANPGGGTALIDSGESITIDSLSFSDLQGDLLGKEILSINLIAIYLGNESATDEATINGVVADGAAGGLTNENMRNDISPNPSALISATNGDGYSLNGIDIQFETEALPFPLAILSGGNSIDGLNYLINLQLSEDVVGFDESDLLVSDGSLVTNSLNGSGLSYTFEVTSSVPTGFAVSIPAASFVNSEGASNIATSRSFTAIDPNDGPMASLIQTLKEVSSPYVVTVHFDRAISGLELSDFEVVNGTLSNFIDHTLINADNIANYSVTVTPTTEGVVNLTLPGGSVAGTPDGLVNLVSNTLVTDFTLSPRAEINGSITSDGGGFDIFISFTPHITGFTADDIQVNNGSVVALEMQGRREHADRFYQATIQAETAGNVTITVPAGVVTNLNTPPHTNSSSNSFVVQVTEDFGGNWVVDTESEWITNEGTSTALSFTDGLAEPAADNAIFSSVMNSFATPRKASKVSFTQSKAWDNWVPSGNISPSGAGNAPIFLPVGNDDYYFFAQNLNSAYHAWHSTDMVNWTMLDQFSDDGENWATSAEYKDGTFYLMVDTPNDHTPSMYTDTDLNDGQVGTNHGVVIPYDTAGGDSALFRDNADGLFHVVSENQSPIRAPSNSFDSPLAHHVTSVDGINGFIQDEHLPAIDFRTEPTGTFGSYNHPHVSGSPVSNPRPYEIHIGEQKALGDWTMIKVGERYYLVGDYEHDEAETDRFINVGICASDSIYDSFELVGDLGDGHPDPTIGFAEGQFYLITQTTTDYISPGPWVDGVEARAGVDTNNDGSIDQWTAWQTISEFYQHTPGYARVVTTIPAEVDMSSLPAGYGFQFEFRTDDTIVSGATPIMDRVEMDFDPTNFQQWSNTRNAVSIETGDHNNNGLPNLIEFAIGTECLPERNNDGSLVINQTAGALEDGNILTLEFSKNLADWTVATSETDGVQLLETQLLPNGDQEMTFEVNEPEPVTGKLFWRVVVSQV